MTDDEVKTALSDFDAFWLTLWAEARSEPVEGQIAVASVIRNRVGKRFGDTYKAVCLAPKQFSCWNPGADENHVWLIEKARLVVGDYAERSTLPNDPAMRQLKYLAQGVMNGDLMSNVKTADHYLTAELLATRPPAWAKDKTPVKYIGAHAFLQLG